MPSIQQSGNVPDKSDKITFRLSPDLKRALRVRAAQRDMSLEDLLVELLTKGLGGMPAAVTAAVSTSLSA